MALGIVVATMLLLPGPLFWAAVVRAVVWRDAVANPFETVASLIDMWDLKPTSPGVWAGAVDSMEVELTMVQGAVGCQALAWAGLCPMVFPLLSPLGALLGVGSSGLFEFLMWVVMILAATPLFRKAAQPIRADVAFTLPGSPQLTFYASARQSTPTGDEAFDEAHRIGGSEVDIQAALGPETRRVIQKLGRMNMSRGVLRASVVPGDVHPQRLFTTFEVAESMQTFRPPESRLWDRIFAETQPEPRRVALVTLHGMGSTLATEAVEEVLRRAGIEPADADAVATGLTQDPSVATAALLHLARVGTPQQARHLAQVDPALEPLVSSTRAAIVARHGNATAGGMSVSSHRRGGLDVFRRS